MYASILLACSALVIFVLGSVHLVYTFSGGKLMPGDPEVRRSMEGDSPRISRQTTMWKAWIGFNASHSLGAMFFGLVYAYLAIAHPALMFSSAFLLGVGALLLVSLLVLARRYWFSIPFRGIGLSFILYVAAVVVSRV